MRVLSMRLDTEDHYYPASTKYSVPHTEYMVIPRAFTAGQECPRFFFLHSSRFQPTEHSHTLMIGS